MKRLLTLLLTLGLLFTLSTTAFASSDVKINANSNILKDAQAVIQNGSTLLPVRSVSNAFGCEVDWNGDTKTVSVNKDDTQITIVIGQKELTVNDTKQSISAPAQIINGRTYVPLRALGEALDCEIQWVNDTRTVEITPNAPAEYKAWYEVDENGQVWLKTNINSRSWNGFFIITEHSPKNSPEYHALGSNYGDGIIQQVYQTYGSQDIFFSQSNGTSLNTITNIYIFKGKENYNTFWNMYSRHNFDIPKALSLMQDDFVCKVSTENNVIVKEQSQKLKVTDFKIVFDKTSQTESCSVLLTEKLSKTADYSLHFDNANKNDFTGRGFAQLEKIEGSLGFIEYNAFFTKPGRSGTFCVVCNEYSMSDNGTIIISRMISDGIAYTFPE